jgi:hypothetical protein
MNNLAAEYIPTEAESEFAPPLAAPRFKLTREEFHATLDATRAVLTDPALTQGAKSLFSYYLEFSFVPDCGGLKPGSIFSPVDYTARRLHAKINSVVAWKRQLIARGYIWLDKFRIKSYRPWEIINVSCLTPQKAQGDLFDPRPYPHFQGLVSQYLRFQPSVTQNGSCPTPQKGSCPTPQKGSCPTPQKDNGTNSIGVKDLGVRKAEPRKASAKEQKSVRFVNEINAQIAAVEKQIKAIRETPANLKRHIAPEVAEAITWMEGEIKKLSGSKKPEDKAKVAKWRADIESRRNNPKNYVTGKLLPSPAAEVANLTMRKQELERQLAFLE